MKAPRWSLLFALTLAACGGSNKEADVPKEDPKKDVDQPPPKKDDPPPPKKEGVEALSADQKKQMEIALKRGGDKSTHCPDVVDGMKGGEGDVKVTFDGEKGRVTEAVVPAPWAGTPAEACIKRAFVGEIIMPFEGKPLEVPYTIKITAKGAPPPPKKK